MMSKITKHIFQLIGIASILLPLTVSTDPAMALMEQKLGVVRSPENERSWPEIQTRLKLMDVDYCILDAGRWTSQADLDNVKVLLLPNVAKMNAAQTFALERWMLQGGKVIVTGPTGNLSRPEIRSQLRLLFGAYWGYPLPSASTIEPQPEQNWIGYNGLTATLNGAVLITQDAIPTETAAIWLAEETPPAVVFTDSSIVFGWRWGVNAVSQAQTDIAWLTAALNYYEEFIPMATSGEPEPCNPPQPNDDLTFPSWQKQSEKTMGLSPIERQEIQNMNQELEGLISRFEMTLNMSYALNQTSDLSTSQIVENILDANQSNQFTFEKTKSYQALIEAKKKHQTFLQLIKAGEYQQAKHNWFQTRRLLLDNYPIEKPLAQSEVRAIWLDRGTIVKAKSPKDLAEIFDRLYYAGINTVFFETLNASYPIYPSQVAPEQNPLVKGWDPLAAAVNLARERNMELHAWVWVFAGANQVHNEIINQPKEYLGPVLSANPDWVMLNKQGKSFDYSSKQKKAFYDPANPEVKQYLLSILKEISNTYQVDGIHLDYIRYPFQTPQLNQSFGYSKTAREQFQALTGVDPLNLTFNDPLWSDWTDFRVNQINNFIFTISKELKQDRPELILSTAVFPMDTDTRINTIQQDWEYWANQEWIDMIVLMSYGFNTEQLQRNTQNLIENSQLDSTLVVPGIQIDLYDLTTIDKVQLLRNLPTDGYALFAAEDFQVTLERIFRLTQGNVQQPIPYRHPFQSLAQRYYSLQQEWNFLLNNNQIFMSDIAMQEWSEEIDTLAIALNDLANQPSRRNLLTAQIYLSSFRRRFSSRLRQQSEINPNQVKAWENRLTNLDRLLNYGMRKARL